MRGHSRVSMADPIVHPSAIVENGAKIAAGGTGRKHSEETKAKMRATHLRMISEGKLFNETHIENMRVAQAKRRAREQQKDL